MNGLMIPSNAPWLADFVSELLSFPTGRNDDQADALGLIGQLLDLIHSGDMPTPKPSSKDRLEYVVTPSGVIQGNLGVRQAVEALVKRKRRDS
jgi:hypothetical protein